MLRPAFHLVPAALLTLSLAAPGLAQTAQPSGAPAAPTETAAPQPADASAAIPAATDAATDAAPAADASGAAQPVVAPDAPAGEYTFDQRHSQIVFSYDHMGRSTSHGMIRGVAGTVTLDPANPGASKVQAMFPLSSLMTIAADLDEHLMSKDFFNGAAPATAITFDSTDVELTGDTTAKVTGDLTLNGVTKPVTLNVTLRRMGEDPMTKKPVAGFDITGSLKRSDFNLGAFAPAVSDEVDLLIAVEALKG